jgi:hypothetical protein
MSTYISVSRHTATQINQANCGLAAVTSLLNYMIANGHFTIEGDNILNDEVRIDEERRTEGWSEATASAIF